MITQELVSYIIQQLNNQREEHFIRDDLLKSGWSQEDVDEAFLQISYNQGSSQNESSINHLMSPSLLLANAWSLYKKKWKIIVKLLIFSKILYLPIILFSLTIGFGYVYFVQPLANKTLDTISALFLVVLVIVFFLCIIIIQGCEGVATLLCLSPQEKFSGVVALYKKSFPKVKSYWMLLFLESIIVIGGFMLFFIPGIVFLVWFTFSFNILIFENRKGVDALLASKDYVEDRLWAIFQRLAFMTLLIYVVSFVIKFIPGILLIIIKQLPAFHSSSTNDYIPTLIVIPIFILGEIFNSTIMLPLSTIYNVILYNNVKQIHENIQPVYYKKSKLLLILPGLIGILLILLLFGSIIFSSLSQKFQLNKIPTAPRIQQKTNLENIIFQPASPQDMQRKK